MYKQKMYEITMAPYGCYGWKSYIERRAQRACIRRYANTYNINLYEECKIKEDTYYDLRKATDAVEKHFYDAIIMANRNVIQDEKLRSRFEAYAMEHNVRVVYVEECLNSGQ